jgi:putative oxidoreductase
MDVIDLVGRVLFASLFALNGWAHLTQREAMVGLGRAIGAPRPELSVPFTGVVMLVSAALIALGVWADLGALLLVVFLPAAGVLAHAYWKETDPMMRAAQQAQFWKNIALTGAALFLLAAFAQYGDDSALTLGSGLF